MSVSAMKDDGIVFWRVRRAENLEMNSKEFILKGSEHQLLEKDRFPTESKCFSGENSQRCHFFIPFLVLMLRSQVPIGLKT